MMYNDYYTTRFDNINSLIYNAPYGKKISIEPLFNKQQAAKFSNFHNKISISSIPSIYDRKVNKLNTQDSIKKSPIVFIRSLFFTILIQQSVFLSFQAVDEIPFIKESIKKDGKLQNNYYTWIPLALTLLSLIILACCEFQRKYPYNYISFIFFTLSAAIFLMVLNSSSEIVFFFICSFGFSMLLLTIFSCQTKFHYTIYTSFLISFVAEIISFTIFFLIDKTKWTTYIYSEVLTTFLLIFFLIDIQIMIKGNHKYQIKENEYIFASITLYTDIINLFIYVLQLLNSAKD